MNFQSNIKQRVAIALIGVALVGAGVAGGFSAARAGLAPAPTKAGTFMTAGAAANPQMTLPDFAQIAARSGPAVVNISVASWKKAASGDSEATPWEQFGSGIPGMSPDDPLNKFFRQFQVPNGAYRWEQPMPIRGQGSGFIISHDGLILTNAHVVRGADEVMVKMTDRREFRAKVLGSDPKTDVAVIKIEAKDLPVVPLGSDANLAVGQWVLAIGSPFGFENSVTAGIVSAKHRSLPDDSFVPFIQTDVPVNPGNSGGPLFNTQGEVVGINSQIYTRSGGYQGVSFAIPIDLALGVKDQLVRTGHVEHARLGVTVQEVNQSLADSFKLDRPEGALVSSVTADSGAERAGLKPGDVIRAVDGQAIVASGDLPEIIGRATPGATVTLDVWRQGHLEQLKAKLGDLDEKAVIASNGDESVGKGRLGLALRPMEPQERQQTGVHAGLVVERVAGPAARAGVQPGDVLVAVNGTPVKSVDQVKAAVGKGGKSVALLVERNGSQILCRYDSGDVIITIVSWCRALPVTAGARHPRQAEPYRANVGNVLAPRCTPLH